MGNAPCSFSVMLQNYKLKEFLLQPGLYGGSDPADNLCNPVCFIRHGGAEIGEGNEINGLTLGGVGTGTTIDHIEVVGNVDDGTNFLENQMLLNY